MPQPFPFRRIAALSVIAGLGVLSAQAAAEYCVNGYAAERQFTFCVTPEQEEKSPAWEDDAANPPVSARQAIALADGVRKRLVADGHLPERRNFRWDMVSASLTPLDREAKKWCWDVYYENHIVVGGSSGIPEHLHVLVLMDGTAVRPKVRMDKNP